MVEAITSKNGEIQIETSLRRSAQGLLVTVKASPAVEEFMQRVSEGDTQAVIASGRYWLTEFTDPLSGKKVVINPNNLEAYSLYHPIPNFRSDDGVMASLENIGRPIFEIDMNEGSRGRPQLVNRDGSSAGDNVLNLSFIRLVGISNPEGVKFLLKSVISFGSLQRLRDQIQTAQNTFFRNYIKTIEYVVSTISQQTI